MNLYEINREYENAFMTLIDPETGEILDDTSVLDQLSMERDKKIEDTACYIKNLLAESEAIKAEAKKLTARAKTCENRAEWLKRYLANNLQGEAFKTARAAVSWRKSESVQVDDIKMIPEMYLRYKDPEPDKTALKKALKAGEVIDGAELVTSLNMQIK